MSETQQSGSEPGTEAEPATTVPTGQAASPEEPTVGTGSAVALGCVAATVLMLLVGVLIVMWLR